jgi:hypothetical protein
MKKTPILLYVLFFIAIAFDISHEYGKAVDTYLSIIAIVVIDFYCHLNKNEQ